MKCKCGGLMQLRRLSIDTEAHVCILCGRDNMPRRTIADLPAEPLTTAVATKPVSEWKLPRTCPGCGRGPLIFTGRCQRCRYRAQRGLDLVTGERIVTQPVPVQAPESPRLTLPQPPVAKPRQRRKPALQMTIPNVRPEITAQILVRVQQIMTQRA